MYPAVDYYPRTMQEGQSLHVKHRIYCGEFLSVHIDVNSSCFRSNRSELEAITLDVNAAEAAFYYAIMKFFWNQLFGHRRNLLTNDNVDFNATRVRKDVLLAGDQVSRRAGAERGLGHLLLNAW